MNIANFESKINQISGKVEYLRKMKLQYEIDIAKNTKRQVTVEKVQTLLQKVAQDTQEQLVFHINNVVNAALNTVFPDKYSFKLVFEIKRNKTEARLVFFNNDGYEINPMQASGGGVVDIASFALRVAAWSLGKSRNVLFLDEPMKWLSKNLQPKAGEILKEMAETLNLQIIMGTHIPELIEVADAIYHVSLNNGVSTLSTKAIES